MLIQRHNMQLDLIKIPLYSTFEHLAFYYNNETIERKSFSKTKQELRLRGKTSEGDLYTVVLMLF